MLALLLGSCLLASPCNLSSCQRNHELDQNQVLSSFKNLHQGASDHQSGFFCFSAILAAYVNVKLLSPKILLTVSELVLNILEVFCAWEVKGFPETSAL